MSASQEFTVSTSPADWSSLGGEVGHRKLSRYVVAADPVLDETDGRVKRVVFATRTGMVRVIDEIVWQRLLDGAIEGLPGDLLGDLERIQALVRADQDELHAVLESNRAAAQASDDLYVVVQPTAMCQLGCDYCGQHHTPRQLDEKDQSLLVQRVENSLASGKFRSLSVCWFGGEPLLGISVMRRLSDRLQEIARSAGCAYGAKIVTNGLALSPRMADELVGCHRVNEIEFTLDGDAAAHDVRRHRKNGNSTFTKIFANLTSLAQQPDLDVRINVRCNVDRRNADAVLPLIRALAAENIQRRINFYTAAVYSWGNEAHRLALSASEYASLEIDWLIEQSKLGFLPSLIPGRRPVVCMSVVPHSRLYDANGGVFNCTEVSYVPSYGTPNKFEAGHLGTEENAEVLSILGDFNDRIVGGQYPCARCEMLPVCGGSCPKKWLEGLTPCPSAKFNIKQRLLLAYADHRELTGQSSGAEMAV